MAKNHYIGMAVGCDGLASRRTMFGHDGRDCIAEGQVGLAIKPACGLLSPQNNIVETIAIHVASIACAIAEAIIGDSVINANALA